MVHESTSSTSMSLSISSMELKVLSILNSTSDHVISSHTIFNKSLNFQTTILICTFFKVYFDISLRRLLHFKRDADIKRFHDFRPAALRYIPLN